MIVREFLNIINWFSKHIDPTCGFWTGVNEYTYNYQLYTELSAEGGFFSANVLLRYHKLQNA